LIRPVITGAAIFVLSFVYRLPDAASLINDHFMHVAWGRQLLWGRLPIRDAVSLGMPLQTGLSAASEWLVGYRLLSEALIISTAFAAAAVLTFVAVRRATGRLWMAVAASLLEIAVAPRTYSYPKILVYAAGILLLWRYIDRPSSRRAIELGVATVIAFYLRHDHGLYLGVVAVAVIAMRHGGALRVTLQQTAVLGAVCLLLVVPYFAYVQMYGGVRDYIQDLRQFSAREHSANPFVWPAWPIRSINQIARWTSPDQRAANIAIRWNPNASDDARRQAVARYGLQAASQQRGSIESGRYMLRDVSRTNATALIGDPAIEDTAGIDRVTGEIRIPGLYVGPVRLLQGLDDVTAAAALLFFVFLAVSAATAVVLARGPSANSPLGPWERVKIAAVLIIAILTFVGFVRQTLDARIADAVVAPVVLGAWLASRWLDGSSAWRAGRIVRVAALTAVVLVITRSVVVAGGVPAPRDLPDAYRGLWTQLSVSPPFNVWPAAGSVDYQVVRYVRRCTGSSEPLLVLWFAPELYYYADRPFAGRLGAYMKGYYTSDTNQRKNIAALERDRPPLAIMEAGREQTDLATHPLVLSYLAEHYHELGRLPATDGTEIRVFGRNDRQPKRSYADLGWPCYR
jgi:hypothetical protein